MNFSIIIPTYREAANISALANRIASVDFGQRKFEVLLMDDNSQDGIVTIVNQLRQTYPWLKVIVRCKKRDLSLSIIQGFEMAAYPVLVTMDADLSHPPEVIPAMLDVLADAQVDIVIGSRYVMGGSSDRQWPLTRRLASRMAAAITRILLLRNTKDPLSGFLAFKKIILTTGDPLTPIGWKVGLELMIKCRCKIIRELPIHFSQRYRGKSKLDVNVSFNFLRHVVCLTFYKMTGLPRRIKRSSQ